MRYAEWSEVEKPWRECFRLGWESYKKGSIPIGAVITDHKSDIVACGRSMQYEDTSEDGGIYRHKLSHAELNALIKISEFDHPEIRRYTLYTTTEPCPLCFGAVVMAHVRNVAFIARDRYAGSVVLNEATDYIRNKRIKVDGPLFGLEDIQVAIHTSYELKRGFTTNNKYGQSTNILIKHWEKDSPAGVNLGKKLYEEGTLDTLKARDADVESVYMILRAELNSFY